VKRSLGEAGGQIDSISADEMIEATGNGVGGRHAPDQRQFTVSVNHVHRTIADVHVTGDVYVDYLQMVRDEGQWQILNCLWAFSGDPA
jgi:hypothetical protein